MTRLSHLKLGLTAVGVILLMYGIRTDQNRFRWFGIAFVAAAVILRFWTPRRSASAPPDE